MSRNRFGLLAAIAMTVALLLTPCGSDEPTTAPAATPTQEPGTTPTPTPDAAARFQAEWDALIAAAQDEGTVNLVFGGGAGRDFRPIANLFGEKFGIEMVISSGSGRTLVNRILAEQDTGRYLVDALYAGPTSVGSRLIPANAVVPVADLFVHPEVLDKSLWYRGKHYYSDPEQQFAFAFAANAGPQNMGMRYNTELVTQADIDNFSSVFDFLDPRWKGKIVARVPGGGGAGYHTTYVHPDIGTEWIDRFLSPELDVTFSPDQRFIVDGIVNGKFAMGMAMGGAGRDLDGLASLGAPVKALVKEFKEGGILVATGSTHHLAVPINQPHPNAAKLWVNWWLSKEGQTLMHTMADVEPDPTLREDVSDWGKTAEAQRRVAGQDYYFFGTDPEFVGRRQEALDYVTDAYANR